MHLITTHPTMHLIKVPPPHCAPPPSPPAASPGSKRACRPTPPTAHTGSLPSLPPPPCVGVKQPTHSDSSTLVFGAQRGRDHLWREGGGGGVGYGGIEQLCSVQVGHSTGHPEMLRLHEASHCSVLMLLALLWLGCVNTPKCWNALASYSNALSNHREPTAPHSHLVHSKLSI